MKRPIAIGLAPNTQRQDVWKALRLILRPDAYKKGRDIRILEKWFENYFPHTSAVSFASGRGGLYAILCSLGIKTGDEVILQAFTCSAVVQAIISTGAMPIFADITNQMTLSPKSVVSKITRKTKAILVQHTFNIPADMEAIMALAKKNNIFLIEDVAHGIGGEYQGKKLGTFGQASIFSFGRDKAFSCTSGGMVVVNKTNLAKKIREMQDLQSYPSILWILQNLLHPILFYFLILPLYDTMNIGKLILVILQKLHVLSFPVDITRVRLVKQDYQRMPNALAALVKAQLMRISEMNQRRVEISQKYHAKVMAIHPVGLPTIPFLRYPIFVKNASKCIQKLRTEHIYLGNWYANGIDPKGVSLQRLHYEKNSCPNAKRIAEEIINLPTYYSLSDKDIDTVIHTINEYVARQRNNA